MDDRALVPHTITAEVNPLQMSILMEILSDCMPEIRTIFERQTVAKLMVSFDDVGKAVSEIYSRCLSECELYYDAKMIFEQTGKFPDFQTVLEVNTDATAYTPGPGEKKEIEFELIPAHEMVVYLLLRGYFDQFQEMMTSYYTSLVHLDFGAMQESADAIHNASIAKTDIMEKAAPIIEVFRMTGQFPSREEN